MKLTAEQIRECEWTIKCEYVSCKDCPLDEKACIGQVGTTEAADALLDHIAQLEAEVAAMREAIQNSLRREQSQRPTLNRCMNCQKQIVDTKQRKYKYGCESLCREALEVIVGCGFKLYEPFIPYASDWRPLPQPPEAKGE